jgi:hypothetical protein
MTQAREQRPRIGGRRSRNGCEATAGLSKVRRYLATDLHVVSTPLDSQLEGGITYLPDNKAETIAATLKQVIESRSYERSGTQAALQTYGPEAIFKSLNLLVKQVLTP